jgi:nitrite reductase/ring-hydroxylating ferredoxin subunit
MNGNMRPMAATSEWRCRLADLPPGRTAKFSLRCGPRTLEGFIVNHDGDYFAYLNRCAHVGTPLDLWPNEFLSEDARSLVCATHGAVYEPTTGGCTAGPCLGQALTPLPLRCERDDIVVHCPSP